MLPYIYMSVTSPRKAECGMIINLKQIDMRKLEETIAMDRVCCGCKRLKGLSRKNVFGEFVWSWYCTANCAPNDVTGCRAFEYRD